MFGRNKHRDFALRVDPDAERENRPALNLTVAETGSHIILPWTKYKLDNAVVVQDKDGVRVECSSMKLIQ